MCNWCEPNGWTRRTCNVCGRDALGYAPPVMISISIATDDPDSLHPYTTTDICIECAQQDGAMIKAKEHNDSTRELQGLTPLDL